MNRLTKQEKERLIELIREGKPIPSAWKARLFDPADQEFIEATKVYQLVYKGKYNSGFL